MATELVQIGTSSSAAPRARRPEWLRVRLATPEQFLKVRRLVDRLDLHTVCQEARCPNIYECWGQHGTATFMILGDVCTRRCGFCAVTSGKPNPGVDEQEPEHVAEAVETMGLRHAVLTSVDRDDLPDAGAGHFARTIRAVKARCPETAVEVLTPDFRRVERAALDLVLGAEPEVFSHNMETVPRLYRRARPGSSFERSLGLLREAARRRDGGHYGAGARAGRVKTGLLVGLGETDGELAETLGRIADAGVEILTVGQYLQPTREHLPVDRYVHPDDFARIRERALSLGFAHCEAGPLVRSSYHAHEHVGAR
jgi:lipoic acid synthetase